MKKCICYKCKKNKTFTQFYKSNTRNSGIDSICKKCDKEKSLLRKIKRCSSCKADKAKSQFSKNRSKPDGLATECKVCHCKGQSQSCAKKREINRVQDKQIIKNARAEEQRQRAIKIMSVPIAAKSSYVYWVLKSYTYRADSTMEPIRLTKGRG